MYTVQVFIQDFPTFTSVVFMDERTQKQLGRTLHLKSEEKLTELLRKGRADRETVCMVELSLSERRPCKIDLRLDEEQYRKLCKRRNGHQPG